MILFDAPLSLTFQGYRRYRSTLIIVIIININTVLTVAWRLLHCWNGLVFRNLNSGVCLQLKLMESAATRLLMFWMYITYQKVIFRKLTRGKQVLRHILIASVNHVTIVRHNP